MRTRLGMVVLVGAVLCQAHRLPAERGTVITKDGRKIPGDITQDDGQVRVNRQGIVIILGKDEVAEIRTAEAMRADYRTKLEKLAADDLAGHIDLAVWCRDHGLFDEAAERCEYVLDKDAANVNAKLLLRSLQRRARESKRKPRAAATTKPTESPYRAGLLTEEQIYRVRLSVYRPGEDVGVRFKNNVLDRFCEAVAGTRYYDYRGWRDDFRALDKRDQLAEIVDVTGMYFADGIEIRSDPAGIRVFRREILPMVRQHCASLKCHGGAGESKFQLYTQRTTAAEVTNFLVLDKYEKDVLGRGRIRMLDRAYPEEGFLPNYLLPRALSDPALEHPIEIEPAVRDRYENRYLILLAWLKEILPSPRVEPRVKLPTNRQAGDREKLIVKPVPPRKRPPTQPAKTER